jgi:hypothetical protein
MQLILFVQEYLDKENESGIVYNRLLLKVSKNDAFFW